MFVVLNQYNLTPRAKKAYNEAFELAKKRKHTVVNHYHVLLSCIKNSTFSLDKFFKSELLGIEKAIEDGMLSIIETDPSIFFQESDDDIQPSESYEIVLHRAFQLSNSLDQHYISIEHIILAIFETCADLIIYLKGFEFGDENIDVNQLIDCISEFLNGGSYEKSTTTKNNKINFNSGLLEEEDINKELKFLNKYCVNFNQLVIEGEISKTIGRDKEIDLLIEILSKKKKKNAVLIGEAGVGKTAIVEGLAYKIVNAEVPSNIMHCEIFEVSLTSLVSGTKYRGEFEKRIKKLIDIASKHSNIILFFDEIHTVFGTGDSGKGLDAANILKPALARGSITCIGATTLDEYQAVFENDKAIKRRFEAIDIKEPSKEDTLHILYGIKDQYEDYHNVKYSEEVLTMIVELCDKFLPHKQFPDKAIDIIDCVGAKVKISNLSIPDSITTKYKELINKINTQQLEKQEVESLVYDYVFMLSEAANSSNNEPSNVEANDVLESISFVSKIPLKNIKKTGSFIKFHTNLISDIFGQDECIKRIYDLLACSKAGLNEDGCPLASFLFVGPTSVGKTYTAKKIAEYYFGGSKNFLQLNMSEYQDEISISKLIGASAGYVGYDNGSILTNHMRNNPNTVVLFDEIEKCHPNVLDVLLHILDEGYIHDNKGNKIDFTKSIIILTSNLGHAAASKGSIGFINDESKTSTYLDSVKSQLKPELVARINEILVFKNLEDEQLKKIIKFEISRIRNKLKSLNIQFRLSSQIEEFIFNKIKSENLNARDIKNLIDKEVRVPVSHFIASHNKVPKINLKIVDKVINVS